MIINAVSYARFSSNNQREESIEIQQEHINQYCKDNGITIIREYVDRAMSATSDNRPQFQKMIKDAESGMFSYVVVYNSSRFCRNIQDHLRYRAILESYGVRILSVNENFDESTPEGDLMSNFMMSINQYYSRDLGRKTYLGCLETARDCKHVGGVPPYGYSVDENQKYVVNESEAEIVRMIFTMIEKGKSRKEICEKLDKMGAKSRKGGPLRPDFVRMAQNRKYIGEFVWNLNSKRNTQKHLTSLDGKYESEVVRIPDGIPAIISKEQFLKVQNILLKRKNAHVSPNSRSYLLTSLLKCGYCGYRMYVDRNTNGNGKGSWVRMNYRCYSSNKRRANCTTKDFKVQYLDSYITNLLNNVLLNERYSKHITELIRKKLGNEYTKNKQKLVEIEISIEKNKEQVKNLIKSLAEARSVAYQEIVKEIERLTKEKAELELEAESMKNELADYPCFNEVMTTNNIRKLSKMIKSQTVEYIKPVLHILVDEIVLTNETTTVKVNLNAYLNDECNKDMIVSILEESENIRKADKQLNQKLSWIELNIQM